MSRSPIVATLLALFLLAGPIGPGSIAAQDAVRLPKPLEHQVSVTLKLIQVYVTDKKGEPVLDLTKDDFTLTDDGKLRKLSEFEKHAFSLPSAEVVEEEKLAATQVSASPRRLERKIFLFFDFGHGSPQGVVKAREAALHFLANGLMPMDQVAMVSYSLFGGMKIHESLTSKHDRIRALVQGIGLHDSLGYIEDAEDGYSRGLEGGALADARPEAGGDGIKNGASMRSSGGGGNGTGQSMQSDARFHARNYISRLTGLAQALRYEPGQKIIILFSSGVPAGLIYNMEPPVNRKGDMNTDLRGAYEELCGELATSNVTVYPMDMAPVSAASESQMGSATLMKMASATGGRFLGNVFNYIDHFQKLRTLTGYYYVLGYSVDETWDGRYHKIKVSVSRPGLEIHAQAGYFSPKPFSDYAAVEKRIQLVDLALSGKPLSQIPLRFSMTAIACAPPAKDNLCLAAEIPVEKIKAAAGQKAEVLALVFNDKDEIVSERRGAEDFTGMARTSAFVLSRASVPPGHYRCRIIIRNMETGAAAVATATTVVPAALEKGLMIFPPLLVRPERGALFLKDSTSKSAAETAAAAAFADSFLFDAGQYGLVADRKLRKSSEAWASIRCAVAGAPSETVTLTAGLYDKAKLVLIPVNLTIISRRDKGGRTAFFVKFEIPDLEPDEYALIFTATDPAGGPRAQIAYDVIIE
jgi:VWFA-related protein